MKKILLSSILTIALCLSLIAGSTFALFTSESTVNVAATAGKVNVTAKIDGASLEASTTLSSYTDASTAPDDVVFFQNYGSATVGTDGKLLLSNMMPGDVLTFKIKAENHSNVHIQYRVKMHTDGELASSLVTTATLTANGTTQAVPTDWHSDLYGETADDLGDIEVKIAFPNGSYIFGNGYQGKSASISFTVEAVQGNGAS